MHQIKLMICGSVLENPKNLLVPKGYFKRHHVAVLRVLILLDQLRTQLYCVKGSFFPLLFFGMGRLFSEPITWDVVIAAY